MTKSHLGFDLTPPTPAQITGLAARLDPEARRILLDHGTEAPFCGKFDEYEEEGTYDCNLCGLPLFDSRAKFHSGSGWPKFLPADRSRPRPQHRRPFARHGANRNPLRPLRCPPRPRLR